MIISFLLSLIAILIYFPTNIVKIIFLIIFVGLIHLYSSYVFQQPIFFIRKVPFCLNDVQIALMLPSPTGI